MQSGTNSMPLRKLRRGRGNNFQPKIDIRYATNNLKKNKKFVLDAVKQNFYALKYASEDLRNDKQVVLEAVKYRGIALRYASRELKMDKDVVLEAVQNDPDAIMDANEMFKGDKDVMLIVVKKGQLLREATDELKGDEDIVFTALENNPWAITHVITDDNILKNKLFDYYYEYVVRFAPHLIPPERMKNGAVIPPTTIAASTTNYSIPEASGYFTQTLMRGGLKRSRKMGRKRNKTRK